MNICNKIESLQRNAALAITGTIRGSSKEKLYQELDFEYLSSKRWLWKLCLFHKIIVNKSPNYLYNYVLTVNPFKLEAATNFYMCVAEQNILRTFSIRTQSRNGIISP